MRATHKKFSLPSINYKISRGLQQMNLVRKFLVAVALFYSFQALSQQGVPVSTVLTQSPLKVDKKFSIELFNYEEAIYSRSKKTQVGDQVELRTRFRYQFTDNAWASLGFTTDPGNNRFNNKTSDFELRVGYNYEKFIAQIDLSINTNDSDGGIALGSDLDSRNTFLSYKMNPNTSFVFYPFNFNGSTGVNFYNDNITNVNYLTNAPNALDTNPLRDETLATKSIPGLELRFDDFDSNGSGQSFYAGVGAATYEYSTDSSFDIRENAASLKWERKEDLGYKLGALKVSPSHFLSFQYVGHTEDKEAGALLKSSLNLYALTQIGRRFMFEFEASMSEAGSTPYRLDREKDWFEVNNSGTPDPRQRVYSDRQNNLQDWIDKTGYAALLKFGYRMKLSDGDSVTPYISYSYFDKNFVYDDYLSVHRLRNNDETTGHGGLHNIGLGAYFYVKNFIIHPSLEVMSAENSVFTNSSDIRNDSIAANFNSYDFQAMINVSYYFDKRTGPRTFRLN